MIDPDYSRAEYIAIEHRGSRWLSPADRAPAGGDWADIIAVSPDIVALIVGDVAGHGIGAAGIMSVLRDAIIEAVLERRIPSQVLALANSLAMAEGNGVLATAIVALANRERGTLTFANAGHPSPILVTRSGCAFLSDSPGDLPLGVFPRHHSAEYVVALPADALVALYTDGITEHNRNIIEGELELTSACRHVYEHGPRNDARAIAEHVLRRGRGRDDAAIVALRTTPARTSAR